MSGENADGCRRLGYDKDSEALSSSFNQDYGVVMKGVADLPRMKEEELTPDQIKDAESYHGNNFMMLFVDLHYRDCGEPNEFIEHYVEVMEGHGDSWTMFLEENQALVAELKDLMEQRERIVGVLNVFFALFRNLPFLSRQKNLPVRHFIYSLEIALKVRLNPLLREAEMKMKNYGLDVDAIKT